MDNDFNKNPELENTPAPQPIQEATPAQAPVVEPQPAQPIQPAQPVNFAATPAPAPKKSKMPIIIGAVVGAIILLGGVGFAIFSLLQPKNFDAIIDKDVACEISQGGLSMNIDGKFAKDKKLTLKMSFLVSAEVTADYEVISTEGNKTTVKITNAKTKVTGLDGKVSEQNSSSQTDGEATLDFENFSKDKTFKISSKQSAIPGAGLICKLKN